MAEEVNGFKVDPEIHIKVPTLKPGDEEKLSALRALVEADPLFQEDTEVRRYVDRAMLFRYLRARAGSVEAAAQLLIRSMQWLKEKRPWAIDPRLLEIEFRTGKYYVKPGAIDRWGRPVMVFDSSIQNTTGVPGQMDGLIFVLMRAIRLMPEGTEKYVIFMNMSNFATRNMPPWSATSETIRTLQEQLPERLGHVVMYQSPWIFQTFFNMAKPLIDPITASKMIFLSGDDSEGSANDQTMKHIIGPNWREMTNAGKTHVYERCSPGYDHCQHWPEVLEEFLSWRKKEGSPIPSEDEKKLREEAEAIKKGIFPKEPEGLLVPDASLSSAAPAVRLSDKPAPEAKKGWFW